MQLAHAGRKASTYWPWAGRAGSVPEDDDGWATSGPSAVPFPGLAVPAAMTRDEIEAVPGQFAAATRRALAAGFDVVEVHAAHGYLLHEFLSPLSNTRTDEYGGSLENRMRLPLEVAAAVRAEWPDDRPLFARISATDWSDGGLTLEDSARLAKELAAVGVDLVDVSTGGNVPAETPVGPGYQVPAARFVREGSGVPVSTVGLITSPQQAEQVLVDGAADAVMLVGWPCGSRAGRCGPPTSWGSRTASTGSPSSLGRGSDRGAPSSASASCLIPSRLAVLQHGAELARLHRVGP